MKRKYIYIVGCLLSFIGMIGCEDMDDNYKQYLDCLLYTSPSPRDGLLSRMPSSA